MTGLALSAGPSWRGPERRGGPLALGSWTGASISTLGSDRAPCRTALEKSLAWWRSGRLALAVDPTLKGDQTTAIVISVVYRGYAIPVAWRIMGPGWTRLLKHWPVPENDRDRADRGLASPKLQQPGEQGRGLASLHEVSVTFCAQGGRRLPARAFVSRPDTEPSPTPNAVATLLAVWYAEPEEPRPSAGSSRAEAVGVSWYALRFWIELGFRQPGLEWDKTRSDRPGACPGIGSCCRWRRCTLADGTRVAQDRRIAPANLRTRKAGPVLDTGALAPISTPGVGRDGPAIRHGIDWLRRLLLRGRLWSRVWLLPEPWPQPKPNLEITRHAPP